MAGPPCRPTLEIFGARTGDLMFVPKRKLAPKPDLDWDRPIPLRFKDSAPNQFKLLMKVLFIMNNDFETS